MFQRQCQEPRVSRRRASRTPKVHTNQTLLHSSTPIASLMLLTRKENVYQNIYRHRLPTIKPQHLALRSSLLVVGTQMPSRLMSGFPSRLSSVTLVLVASIWPRASAPRAPTPRSWSRRQAHGPLNIYIYYIYTTP